MVDLVHYCIITFDRDILNRDKTNKGCFELHHSIIEDAIVHGRFVCLGASSEGSAGTGLEPC
jgi:hypothetical protein